MKTKTSTSGSVFTSLVLISLLPQIFLVLDSFFDIEQKTFALSPLIISPAFHERLQMGLCLQRSFE